LKIATVKTQTVKINKLAVRFPKYSHSNDTTKSQLTPLKSFKLLTQDMKQIVCRGVSHWSWRWAGSIHTGSQWQHYWGQFGLLARAKNLLIHDWHHWHKVTCWHQPRGHTLKKLLLALRSTTWSYFWIRELDVCKNDSWWTI